jgi:hypothetical protein
MWPYTQDEMKWLALPHERAAADRTQRAIDDAWMTEIGVLRQPANDASACHAQAAETRR